jgi:peptidyl-prolyl cis-trans isomerase B (cyclophilin B)
VGRRQARLNALLATALLGVALGPVAQAGVQDVDVPAGEEIRARVEAASQQALDALGALGAAHRSGAQTVGRLTDRLTGVAQRAEALELDGIRQQALDLTDELHAFTARADVLQAEVSGLADDVAERSETLLSSLDPPPLPHSAEFDAALVELAALDDGVAPLATRSDSLVQDLTGLNAAVESLSMELAGTELPQVDPGAARAPQKPVDLSAVPVVELTTSEGVLVLALRPDEAPETVENFLKLVRQGFYDGLTFHRVVPRFLAQGGCPEGDGSGGPGWTVDAEFNDLPHRAGTLSMARFAHPDSAGSQFFLCLDDWSSELDGRYTVFGNLLVGRDTLNRISEKGSETGVPSESVVIERALARARRPEDTPASSDR